MSFPRLLGTPASPFGCVLKFASSAGKPSPAAQCQRFYRFTSSAVRPSSKRQLQTATAHRPTTFEPSPLPPRNSPVPDTSIAGGVPRINDTRPLEPSRHLDNSSQTSTERTASYSLPEAEAQKSSPPSTTQSTPTTTNTTPAPSPSAPAPKPRSKLRARKAAMSLTPSATAQLQQLLNQPEPKLIRVGVKNRGCSGLAYHLEYVDKAGAFDESVEQDGVRVLIDSKALFSIIGSEMDWVEDKLNQRFVFRNPNIKEQCGCGESFMV